MHRESEERFRGVFEQAPFGMGLSDPDGRFIQVNAAFLLGTNWTELIHPDDRRLRYKGGSSCGITQADTWMRKYATYIAVEMWFGGE
jgi:PAS domain S-box-containing protein